MSTSSISFVYNLLIILVVVSSDPGSGQDSFITWNDLTIQGGQKVIVVDKNGHGDSQTVQGAVNMVPENNVKRVKIHILPGVYSEKVYVPITKPLISFIGDPNEPSSTVITWHDRASDSDGHGSVLGTLNAASVTVASDYFCASGITFENTVVTKVGESGDQGVSLRISGNKAMLYKVRIIGSQDTLLDESGTHYYYQCFIQGTVDFICGAARSIYRECTISSVDGYAIAAQARTEPNQLSGFSFVNCTLTGTGNLVLLGRAWKPYSQVVYSYCNFNIDVSPQGWSDFKNPNSHKTIFFGEYKCVGKGANRNGRVPWSKALSDAEAKQFSDMSYINGNSWLRL